MNAKGRVNLNIFTLALFIVCQMTQCILLKSQCFYLRRNKGPLVLLSTRNKRIAITLHENQRLILEINIKRGYMVSPHNIIPHQIDETVKKRQMKYQKIVKALDRILYLIGKQGISYQGTKKTATTSDT